MPKSLYDRIGRWSEIKLEIIQSYAQKYAVVLRKHPELTFSYIDAFAGSGHHVSRASGEVIEGSPLRILNEVPFFNRYYFIDLERSKVEALKRAAQQRDNVFIYEGDCNSILINQVFPQLKYKDYQRALCFLDPYGLHLSWRVIEQAGRMRSIEILINFPLMDMNQNVLWHRSERVKPKQAERMTAFWGDESWRGIAYTKVPTLFEPEERKKSSEEIVEAFRQRLKKTAGFKYVSKPLPMPNEKKAIVYYLLFASNNKTGLKIANHILTKHGQEAGL